MWLFDQESLLLNRVGVSCKQPCMICHQRFDDVMKALESGVLEFGDGLNQKMGLPRPSETCWGLSLQKCGQHDCYVSYNSSCTQLLEKLPHKGVNC